MIYVLTAEAPPFSLKAGGLIRFLNRSERSSFFKKGKASGILHIVFLFKTLTASCQFLNCATSLGRAGIFWELMAPANRTFAVSVQSEFLPYTILKMILKVSN
jgi:hypothetical protein